MLHNIIICCQNTVYREIFVLILFFAPFVHIASERIKYYPVNKGKFSYYYTWIQHNHIWVNLGQGQKLCMCNIGQKNQVILTFSRQKTKRKTKDNLAKNHRK